METNIETQTPYQDPAYAPEGYAEAYPAPDGPRQVRLSAVIFRTFSGLIGGVAGSAVVFLIFLLAQALVQGAFSGIQTEHLNPIEIFFVLVAAFLGLQTAAVISVSLLSYCQREKYLRLTSTLVHVFLLNLLMFVFFLPAYIVVSQISGAGLVLVAGLHVFLSVLASSMVMEIVADYRYAILGVYSSNLSILVSILLLAFIYSATSNLVIIPVLLALPVAWCMAGLLIGMTEMFYAWLYEVYGVDYINLETKYGDETVADPGTYAETTEAQEQQIFDDTQQQ